MIKNLLVTPFIENSFKYSLDDINSQAWITISITASEEWLVIKIENSLPTDFSKNKDLESPYCGVGITNVKKLITIFIIYFIFNKGVIIYLYKKYTIKMIDQSVYEVPNPVNKCI